MGREASLFETSEMLANFLASTPLLSQSWSLCNLANTNYPNSFVTQQIGTTGYVAFSGVQSVYGPDSSCNGNQMVSLDGSCLANTFSSLCKQSTEEEEEADGVVMVHGAFLQIFLKVHADSDLKAQMMAMKDKCKSIVITGHSIGGTTASLCALWLLSYLQSISSTCSVLCITFGSAFLGNESLSSAILRERWGGNFCHVVSKHDLMPRLLLIDRLPCLDLNLPALAKFWHLSLVSPSFQLPSVELDRASIAQIFGFVLSSLEKLVDTNEDVRVKGFSPFGNFLFCSEEGAICLDNSSSIIRMMYLLFASGSPYNSIEDHLKYGDYVDTVASQFLMKRDFLQVGIPETSFEAGVTLALQSSGIACQEPIRRSAEDCIKLSRRIGRSPSLNSADLAIKLSKIAPYRAEIEWYKATCDKSDDQMGYYDSFKQRGASKRDIKVNMNRHKLARFWDDVIKMMETNQLPFDFHKREKWVNASQFYMLLVEPLDIAEYYGRNMHREKGHYRFHGRERRYQIFDRWWKQKKHRVDSTKRSTFAGQTQDTCFWARVEEAKDALDNVRKETDQRKWSQLWQELHDFDRYANGLIERKEVSKDVLARNSSYSIWVRDYRELKSQVEQMPPQFPVLMDGLEEMVP